MESSPANNRGTFTPEVPAEVAIPSQATSPEDDAMLLPVDLSNAESYSPDMLQHAYRVALRLTRDPDAAWDAVQDAMLSCYTTGQTVSKPYAYIGKAADNAVKNQGRRASSRPKVVSNEVEIMAELEGHVLPDVAHTVCDLELIDALGRHIAALNEVSREALILAAEGLAYKEIGQRLGVSAYAARARVSRARILLSQCLKTDQLEY